MPKADATCWKVEKMPEEVPANLVGTLSSAIFNKNGKTKPFPRPYMPISEIFTNGSLLVLKNNICKRKEAKMINSPINKTYLPYVTISFEAMTADNIKSIACGTKYIPQASAEIPSPFCK